MFSPPSFQFQSGCIVHYQMMIIIISSVSFDSKAAGSGERFLSWLDVDTKSLGIEMKSFGIRKSILSGSHTRHSGGQVISTGSNISFGKHSLIGDAHGQMSFLHRIVPPNLVQTFLSSLPRKPSIPPSGIAGSLQTAELLVTSQKWGQRTILAASRPEIVSGLCLHNHIYYQLAAHTLEWCCWNEDSTHCSNG